jgi:hypothetical protein
MVERGTLQGGGDDRRHHAQQGPAIVEEPAKRQHPQHKRDLALSA